MKELTDYPRCKLIEMIKKQHESLSELKKWRESEPVQQTFSIAGMLSITHQYLSVTVTKEFSEWAQETWDRAYEIIAEYDFTG